MQTKRAAIYCRISEADTKVDKVEDQEVDCRALCAKQGYEVVQVYEDDAISGYKKKHRPDYLQLLADADAGKFDVIVATRQDRLARQRRLTDTLVWTCEDQGIEWHTVLEGPLDLSDPDDQLMASLRGWMGQREQTLKIKAMGLRFDKRRAEGLPLWGNRPFGFEKDRITHREDEAAELRWAYEHVLNKGSIYSIIKSWNERGVLPSRTRDRREKRERGEPVEFDLRNADRAEKGLPEVKEPTAWSYATVQQLLKRARNAGLTEQHGEIVYDGPCAWEPIVSHETWKTVRALLSDSSRAVTTNREPRWLCAGLARCGVCGAVLRSAQTRDRKASYPIYRCSISDVAVGDGRRHVSVKTSQLDPMVRAAVTSTLLLGPRAGLPSVAADVAEVRRLQARLREVREGLEQVNEMVGRPGFRPALMKKRAAQLDAEEARILKQLAEHARESAHAAMIVGSRAALFAGKRISIRAAARVKAELAERFDALPLEQRRTLVRALLNITVHPGRTTDRIEIENLAVTGRPGPERCAVRSP